jgi:hypothetical protein
MKKTRSTLFTATLLAFLSAATSPAAVLTTVPMGGGMVHVNLLYNATDHRLEAAVEPVIPRLAPLDVTNPADSFVPADPWFGLLDPSQGGLAFNRQYGIVQAPGSDPVPADKGIWVRWLSCTPGLCFYRYRSTDPKAFEPIFGTAGATNVFPWSLSMFHPAVVAPPKDGTHTATFEAFVVNLPTGLPDPGFASAQFTLNWTIVPSARPTLALGNDHVLRWAASATNYVLEASDSTGAGTWWNVEATPVISGNFYELPIEPTGTGQFYRLRRVP